MAKVEVKLENGMIKDVIFLANRMAFTTATKKILNQKYPHLAKGDVNTQAQVDRRHWESNEIIKNRIKHQCVGQQLSVVAKWMVGAEVCVREPNCAQELEAAIYRLWSKQFSEVSNLRLGDADPNQALGRLAGILKPHLEKGEQSFQPLSVDMSSFGWGDGVRLAINTWEELREIAWNANYDFVFNGEAATEIEIAEQYFCSAFPRT